MSVFMGTVAATDAATASGAAAPQTGVQRLIDVVLELMVKYGFQVLGGLIILVIGWFVAKSVAKVLAEFLAKKQMDVTVIKFIASAAKLVVMAFAFLAALGKFGIEVTPLIAGLSVAGVGASLALQGTLSNYAAGTSLIFTKPFKVGEIIEVAGVMGEVEDMSLGSTKLMRVDGVRIVVPNKHVIGEIIHNYSGRKAVDIKVGVGYGSDVAQAIETIRRIIKGTEQVDHAKEPQIGISEFADSSVTLTARVWCKQRDYLDVLFGINRAILEEFKRRGIEIPFPQREVRLHAQDTKPGTA